MATRFANKWPVLAIDLFTIGISFFLAYLIRFNLKMNFDVSKMALQLPVVVLIALIAFLIMGSYKGKVRQYVVRDHYTVFKAIGISTVFIILLIAINHNWEISPAFNIPLSIIIIYSLLSVAGLTASRYVFKGMYNAPVNKDPK